MLWRCTVGGLLALLVCGCGPKLETGYEPRALNATSTERRGYYAAPYSKEAREAEDARQEQAESRRPSATD
jgi:hypothetical protein